MKNFAVLLAFALGAQAHMEMESPAPLRSKFNKNAKTVDNDLTAPIGRAQFPCKGYLTDLGTDAGASVATYAPGSSQTFTITGGAEHGGGSCQISLSYDKGASFTVIKSIIGGCPASGKAFAFDVPSDAPSGDAVLAWTWFNKIGNPEMYMNCASVTIGSASKEKRADSVAFSARPGMFVANLDNGCKSKQEGGIVVFPNPGPDVEGSTTGDSGISGTCAAINGVGGDTGSGSGGSTPASSVSQAPAASTQTPVTSAAPATSEAPATSAAPVTSESPVTSEAPVATETPGGVFISTGLASFTTSVIATPVTSATPTGVGPIVPIGTGTSGAGAQSGACTQEGLFNCIGGTQFQQCASGSWSVAMAVAPGTQCTAGQSMDLAISAASRFRPRAIRRRIPRRFD